MSDITITGVDDLIKRLEGLAKDGTKKREVNKAQRRAFKRSSMISIARRNTPVGDSPHFSDRGGKRGRMYTPGNLRDSVGLITGRSKRFPNIQLGYQAGNKRRNDGWYGKFVHEGEGRGVRKKNRAFDIAFDFQGKRLRGLFEQELGKGIDKLIKRKYGFRKR